MKKVGAIWSAYQEKGNANFCRRSFIKDTVEPLPPGQLFISDGAKCSERDSKEVEAGSHAAYSASVFPAEQSVLSTESAA